MTESITIPATETAPHVVEQHLADDILVTRFQGGDERAFRVLMERHIERIRKLVFVVLNRAELVDDLTQEVFINAYRALPNFRYDASFYTWLYRIAVNRCRDEMRKLSVRKMFSLERLLDARDKEVIIRTSVEADEQDTSDIIHAGLQRLPEKYRVALILKDIEGRSYEEIAEIMQCELGTVKSRLARGRTLMRKYLSPILGRS